MWTGPFETREEALQAGLERARDCETGEYFVGDADRSLPSPNFDEDWLVERLIEDICEKNEECWGEDGPDDPWTAAEQEELGKALQTTVAGWMEKYPAHTSVLNGFRTFDRIAVPVAAEVAAG